MADRPPFPQRKKNALDEFKLRLTAPPVQDSKRRPALAWSLVNNQPRINVYTNVEGDKQNGRISANMDSPTFYAFLELLERACDLEPCQKYTIENKNHTFYNGKRSEKPEVVSKTLVGKDNDGCVFVSVVARDRPKVKFVLQSSYYHQLQGNDGSPLSPAEASVIYAKAYCRMLENYIANVADSHYSEPKPKDGQGGNRGGGGNNSGGGNAPPKDFDKDVPDWASGGGGDDDFPM